MVTFDVDFKGSRSGFRNAVCVYINKPHVVNRRLSGAKMLYTKWHSAYSEELVDSLARQFSIALADECSDELHEGETTHGVSHCDDVDISAYDDGFFIIVRDLIPRQIDKYPTLREIVYYDYSNDQITFRPLCHVNASPPHQYDTHESIYVIKYDHGEQSRLHLSVLSDTDGGDSGDSGHVTTRWLGDVLLCKLARWGEEDNLRTATTSLRLVPVDEYSKLYNHLKVKYGLHFVEVWPERTDPKKFVYEDVAIATYLLLLWKADRERKHLTCKQSFVDMGCGNGLLVHILASEGHPGLGLDIRSRKIWSLYGPETILREQSIIPSADSLFPEYDWLIGNHSDELTPWIPLIAARSSRTCCYFVLPCCLHDFDRKFSVREKGVSPYRTYLNFVREVGEVCGFKTEEDTLRIPSTKRICFIGCERTYSEEEETVQDAKRTAYIQSRCSRQSDISGDNDSSAKRQKLDTDVESQWSDKFKPRSSQEVVRNCQKVAIATKQLIVNTVFERVLAAPDCEVISLGEGRQWRKGGTLPLCDAAELFDAEVLQQMKAENGGLQTLLRNHNNVFQVSGGSVRLRDFSQDYPWSRSKKAVSKKLAAGDYHKTLLCWFHSNHPDGCPRQSGKCNFAHGQEDLKDRPKRDSPNN